MGLLAGDNLGSTMILFPDIQIGLDIAKKKCTLTILCAVYIRKIKKRESDAKLVKK